LPTGARDGEPIDSAAAPKTETQGNIDLVTDSAGGAYARNTSGALDDITHSGNQVSDSYFAGLSIATAETSNGIKHVAWKDNADSISI